MNLSRLTGALLLASIASMAACTDVDVKVVNATPAPTSATTAPTSTPPPTIPPPSQTATVPTTPPMGTPTPTATPTPTGMGGEEIGQFQCNLAAASSSIAINLELGRIPVTNVQGQFENECGAIRSDGTADCSSDIAGFSPINIVGVGIVCVNPVGGCPSGIVDCDGGSGLDVDLLQDHNIGSCDGNPSCATLCESHCANLGLDVFDSGCQGYCEQGPNDGASCDFDSGCPDGSCNGKDPVGTRDICNCQCISIGGESGPAGALLLNVGVQLDVEPALPCGDGDATISLPPTCIPLTTQTAEGVLLQANNNPDTQIGPVSNTGAALDCTELENGRVTDMGLVGVMSFFDSSIGDLEIELDWVCQ